MMHLQKWDMNKLPRIGITMGDPAGIGPEIAIKTLMDPALYLHCRPILVGEAAVFRQIAAHISMDIQLNTIEDVEDALFEDGLINIIDLKTADFSDLQWGEINATCGEASFQSVKKVIELAMEGKLDATVTGPIHKKAIHDAGYSFAGHTEIYAHFTGTKKYAMLLVEDHIRVIHVSTHVSLRQACDLVKKERIIEVATLLFDGMKRLGETNTRIGIAGLNPHAGDQGLFGTEEELEIAPAVEALMEMGFDVEGPVPPDTMFAKAATGYYGGVVAMYHDQGHIPFKLAGFKWNAAKQQMDSVKGVNITLGLPIIRTSVDHGTAFEIAGKGIASPDALKLAIDAAIKLHQNKA